MELENKNNKILDDLDKRNRNWDKLDGVIDQVDELETNKQETKVKISSVEKELNSLKSININSNQEATQVAQGYGVVSLPKTAGEGQVSVSIKGNTVTDETGTKSTISASRLKSVGKNLLPIKDIDREGRAVGYTSGTDWIINSSKGYKKLDNGIRIISTIAINRGVRFYKTIKLEVGKTYTVKTLRSFAGFIRIVGVPSKNYQGTSSLNLYADSYGTATFTVIAGYEHIQLVFYTDQIASYDFTEIQIEQNTVVTPYEPYTESTQYLPNVGELRSLPNGVSDEIVNGELVKRVSDTMEELAEPIITPINVSGNLISYPSGTVYVENVVADAGMYTTKMDILNTDLPIKTLDRLSKVDYTTGLEHSLDVSKAVVTSQSFTHPDLTMGDIVFFEYYYDLESTNGNASVEYYDSRYTVKDSVTNKIYKWSITIANGVPTITTVEV